MMILPTDLIKKIMHWIVDRCWNMPSKVEHEDPERTLVAVAVIIDFPCKIPTEIGQEYATQINDHIQEAIKSVVVQDPRMQDSSVEGEARWSHSVLQGTDQRIRSVFAEYEKDMPNEQNESEV